MLVVLIQFEKLSVSIAENLDGKLTGDKFEGGKLLVPAPDFDEGNILHEYQ